MHPIELFAMETILPGNKVAFEVRAQIRGTCIPLTVPCPTPEAAVRELERLLNLAERRDPHLVVMEKWFEERKNDTRVLPTTETPASEAQGDLRNVSGAGTGVQGRGRPQRP